MSSTEKRDPIRVVIAEDHAVVREALRVMLQLELDVEVVGEASGGEEAIQLAQQLKPDLVLLDVRMAGMDGVEATRQLRSLCPDVAVLILTGYGGSDILLQAVEAGAHGFLLKDTSREEVLDAIHRVARGESIVTPTLLRRLLRQFAHRNGQAAPRQHDQLTPRELEVLQALARGLSNEEIAEQLHISEKTVKTHLGSIFGKLQVEGRTQAMLYAIRHGLAESGMRRST